MNAKQRRRMSRRPKPIPGVETRTARNRRYHRWLDRSLVLFMFLLLGAGFCLLMLAETFSGPPQRVSYEDRKGFGVEVVLYTLIVLMQFCGMSMHAIRVTLICISAVSLLGAGVAWWVFVPLAMSKPKKKDLHQADSRSCES
jgi:hypothetical protein